MQPARTVVMGGLIVVAATLALAGCSARGGAGVETRDAAGVQRFSDREDALVRRGDWVDLYELTTPRYRSGCTLKGFLQAYPAFYTAFGVDLSQFGSRNTHIAVSGDTARVTYILTYKGVDVDAITADDPDVYRYIDGHWYDDVHGYASCDSGGAGNGGAPLSPPSAPQATVTPWASSLDATPTPASSNAHAVTPPPDARAAPPGAALSATAAPPQPTADSGGTWCDGSFWKTLDHPGLDATATAWAAARQMTGTPALNAQDAAALVCRSGFLAQTDAAAYCERCTLHVIFGVGIGSADGHYVQAFFFGAGRYIGTGVSDPGLQFEVAWRDDTTVALIYDLYLPDDPLCCPTGGPVIIRFRWDGQRLTQLDAIPTAAPGAAPGLY